MDYETHHYQNIAIDEKDVLNIILSYLLHNSYNESAEILIACTGVKKPAGYLVNREEMYISLEGILGHALEGNILKAIELTEQMGQDILENNKELLFDLLILHYLELLDSQNCIEALEFAQTRLSPFGTDEKYFEKLQEFMSLLAFEDPQKGTTRYLLSSEYREQVAESLNQTILAYFNLPSHTLLERLIQQATVVRQCLSHEYDEDGPLPFSFEKFLKGR